MLMIDVRNAIARILDGYTLADVVGVTLRKMKRDKLPAPFGIAPLPKSKRTRAANRQHADPRDGLLAFLHENKN